MRNIFTCPEWNAPGALPGHDPGLLPETELMQSIMGGRSTEENGCVIFLSETCGGPMLGNCSHFFFLKRGSITDNSASCRVARRDLSELPFCTAKTYSAADEETFASSSERRRSTCSAKDSNAFLNAGEE